MLKRLLVAVFVLGLLLAFSGSAISGPIGDQTTQLQYSHGATALKGKSDLVSGKPAPNFRSAPRRTIADAGAHATAGVDTAGCEEQDWTDYVNTSGYYAWTLGGGITDEMSMRYDITPSHGVNVLGSRVRVYSVFGSPLLTIKVWGDAAGLPGALLYSESFVPTVGNNVYFFTTPVNITNGGPYHISMSSASVGGDSLWVSSDDGLVGTGRGSYRFGGTWYANEDPSIFGPGFDPNWRCLSEVCQYYVSCYTFIPDPRGHFIDFLPDPAWSDASVLSGTGQKFKAEGPETLYSIRFRHTTGGAFGDTTNYLDAGTNGLTLKIWPDSNGYADLSGGPILSFAYPGGKANMYPHTGNLAGTEFLDIPVPGTPVMLGFYHITVELTSLNPADGQVGFRFGQKAGPTGGGMVKFTPPGSGRQWDNIAGNPLMINEFYGAANYDGTHSCDIRPTLCKSEFTECKYGTATSCGTLTTIQGAGWGGVAGCTPSYYHAWAQRIKGNPVNNIDKIRVQVYLGTSGACTPNVSGATLQICVWQSVGGAPGPLIAAYPVSSIVNTPGWNEVVIPGGLTVLGDFFIGYNIDLFPAGKFMYAGYQNDGSFSILCPIINGGAWVLTKGLGTPPSGLTDNTWYNRNAAFGSNHNLVAEVDYCAIPVAERACVTENDWPTLQHDFGRTGASGVSLDDAWCDLNLNWSHIRPTGRGISLNGPIIWNNYVICAFTSATAGSYVVFNLQTGAIVDDINDAGWFGDNSVIGGNIRCTPTVATLGGVPALIISGGNPGSITAIDLSGGFPVTTADMLWNFNDGGSMGPTRYGNTMVINQGGTDVVYAVDDGNKVYAINGSTGAAYAGWASPYTLSYSSQKGGATDGTNLVYALFNTAGNGKVTAIKASNGTLAWDYTTLAASTYFTGVTAETFEAGAAIQDGEVFAASRVLDGTSDVANLRRGVLYRINVATGATISTGAGERARTTHPTVDKKQVIVPILPPWSGHTSATGGNLTAFGRDDGQLLWVSGSYASDQAAGQVGYIVEGLLTCEPLTSDLYYAFNLQGYLSCFLSDNGNEMYHRRVDHGAGNNQGGMGAIGKDATGAAHLVFTDAYGGIYDMKKGADRPRLELLAGTAAIAVPFGSPADTVVEFPSMYTNTGCTNLVVSLTASTTSNGTTVPAPRFNTIGSRLNDATDQLADALAGNKFVGFNNDGKKVFANDRYNGSLDETITFADARESYNKSAAAVPAFLNQNGGSYAGDVFDPAMGNLVLAPGDTSGIRVHANGPLVNRGPNSFYCEFTVINDPDYYLDNVARRPEVFLTLVGGCLVDTTTLAFGAAGANHEHVFNTTKLARNGTDGFLIDGLDNEIMYQGFIAYGVSAHRQALNSDKWDGTNNEWISIQADPNYCDNNCKPAIQTAVAMGAISADGITYSPLSGSTVCRSFIDSVQNHDLGSGWDWDNHAAPFDNDSTMGLSANAKTFGVLNAPNVGDAQLLHYMTLTHFQFKERNGNAVPGWRLWAYMDHDIASKDTAYYDGANSVGWGTGTPTAGANSTRISGFIKVPFGCGYTPLKNVTACGQNAISFVPDWDSAWFYTNLPAGQHTNSWTAPAATDYGSLYGFDEYDFPASGTHDVGIAYFSFADETPNNNSSGRIGKLARLVNKWAGFGRGDVNNDGVINLADIVYLASNVNYGGPGPIPFMHLGDVDASGGAPNTADITYLVNYYFHCGPCPMGAWTLSL